MSKELALCNQRVATMFFKKCTLVTLVETDSAPLLKWLSFKFTMHLQAAFKKVKTVILSSCSMIIRSDGRGSRNPTRKRVYLALLIICLKIRFQRDMKYF